MENRNNRKTAFDTLKSGVWMNGFDEALGPALERCENLCFRLNALPPSEKTEREALIREILGDIGTGGILHSPFRCDMGFNIHIGNNFTGNFNITILDEADVTIGDIVLLGPNTTLCTIIHAYDAERRNAGIMRARPITIHDNVWIAANVVVLPGVTIGQGAIIGAGSVVTGDVPPLTIAAGNPARTIGRVENRQEHG